MLFAVASKQAIVLNVLYLYRGTFLIARDEVHLSKSRVNAIFVFHRLRFKCTHSPVHTHIHKRGRE